MHASKALFAALTALLLTVISAVSLAQTRALLVACSEFTSQPDLGTASSGNLHLIGSALIGAQPRLGVLSFEAGTIGAAEALGAAIPFALALASRLAGQQASNAVKQGSVYRY